MRRYLLFLIFAFLPAILLCQDRIDSLLKIIDERGEVYLQYKPGSRKAAISVLQMTGFDRFDGESAILYLGKNDENFIRDNIDRLELLTAPSMLYEYSMAGTKEEVLEGTAYATYPLYLEIMQYFSDTWPDICSIDTIGYSIQNRLLLAARIEKPSVAGKHKPVFFYSSSIHGDETLGYSFMLMLINELLTNNEEPGINELLKNIVIYINPLENPDGAYFTSDSTVFGAKRFNINNVDINRNYPDPVKGDHPDFKSWQKETIAMMEYMNKIRPDISANFHGGAEVVNYPFDAFSALHADNDWMVMVASEYADTAMALRPGYMDEFPGGITNGYDWYPVYGGRQDYLTYFLRGREMTIELYNVKTAPESMIRELWDTNRRSLLNYIGQAQYGMQGYVTDSLTGRPLSVEIIIPGHDKLNSSVFSDSLQDGFFVRYLKAGNYPLLVKKSGYEDYYLPSVHIEDYSLMEMEIRMVPVVGPYTELYINITTDPFSHNYILRIGNPKEQEMKISIFDLLGRQIFGDREMIPEGYSELLIDSKLVSGIYFIRLEFENENRLLKIIKAR